MLLTLNRAADGQDAAEPRAPPLRPGVRGGASDGQRTRATGRRNSASRSRQASPVRRRVFLDIRPGAAATSVWCRSSRRTATATTAMIPSTIPKAKTAAPAMMTTAMTASRTQARGVPSAGSRILPSRASEIVSRPGGREARYPVARKYVVLSPYVRLRRAALLAGASRQILVHPSSQTARINPALGIIPTFGTCSGCTTTGLGLNPGQQNIPASRAARMVRTGGITPMIGYTKTEEG